MLRLTLASCGLCSVFMLASCGSRTPSNTNLRSVKMTGHVIQFSDPNGRLLSPVHIGDQMVFNLTFDKTVPATAATSDPSIAHYDFYGSSNTLTAQVGATQLTVNNDNQSDFRFEITVTHQQTSGDIFTLYTQDHVSSNQSLANQYYSINFNLTDSTSTANTGIALPSTAPDPTKYDLRVMSLANGGETVDTFYVTAQIDSIEFT
jgi:hypothetical protein